MANVETYVAFLRGINVGGNKMIKMEELRDVFSSLGFQDVKTLLASGNVLFQTTETPASALAEAIQEKLKETCRFDVSVILRTIEEIRTLAHLDPFKNITLTTQTRLYVTFLSEKPGSDLNIPYKPPGKDFQILRVANGAAFSVLTLTPKTKSTDLMDVLDKTFGKKVTTRNWNTITAILKSSK